MALTVDFVEKPSSSSEILIVPVGSDKKFTLPDGILKQETIDSIKYNLEADPKFKGKPGETFSVPLPKGEAYRSVLFAGFQTGSKDVRPTSVTAAEAGGKLYPALKNAWARAATFVVTPELLANEQDRAVGIARIASGMDLASYGFDEVYKLPLKDKADGPIKLESVEFVTPKAGDVKKEYAPLKAVAEGVFLTRDLANTPPNDLYPETFANRIKAELEPLGVEVTVLDEKELTTMGAGGIMAVGQGSARPPRMVTMRWKGKDAKESQPLAFVGKGVTFDTGGISIKPAAGMEEMKVDMHGAATVVGLMKTLALRGADEHVVGVVGLAENMPSGNAFRPGDIIKTLAGKTVEVLNTDAEGRLVLADCLTHVQNTYNPRTVIDLATLTGAMVVALGSEYTGVFANDEKFWSQMQEASTVTGEKIWRMPLDPAWKKQMESKIADLQNMGVKGRDAGACVAAGFLEHFIDEGRIWSHWDIAGTGMSKEGGTGVGVQTLDELVRTHYEP